MNVQISEYPTKEISTDFKENVTNVITKDINKNHQKNIVSLAIVEFSYNPSVYSPNLHHASCDSKQDHLQTSSESALIGGSDSHGVQEMERGVQLGKQIVKSGHLIEKIWQSKDKRLRPLAECILERHYPGRDFSCFPVEDAYAYRLFCEYIKETGMSTGLSTYVSKAEDEGARAEKRLKDIKSTLKHIRNEIFVASYLDIGAGGGAIAVTVGESLGLSKNKIKVVDVKDHLSPEYKGRCEFHLARPGRCYENLPDSSVQLVTVFMALHHISDPHQAVTIDEMYRVLSPGGFLIIREHDLNFPGLDMVIDLQHLSHRAGDDGMTYYKSLEDWFTKYHSRAEWTELLSMFRFVHYVEEARIQNPANAYYAVYRKPHNS